MSSRHLLLGPWLLDINVLLPLLWPSHDFHSRALEWFLGHRQDGWATCPLTEIGFLRMVMNPAFSPFAATFADAIELLMVLKKGSSNHRFWPADIPCGEAEAGAVSRVTGHQQIPGAYLLDLAVHHQGRLATFDRRILHLTPKGSAERDALMILPG